MCVVIPVVFAVSLRNDLRYDTSGRVVFCFHDGVFNYARLEPGWFMNNTQPTGSPLCWGWYLSASQVIIPLWIPFVLTAIPTAWLWRRDRRYPPGHCQRCAYDLTGNVTGVCSECAEPTTTEKTQL